MFSQLTKKSNKRSGINKPATFLIGGAIGALGAYLLLTEKGIANRKRLVEKAGELSNGIKARLNYMHEGISGSGQEESNEPVAARNATPHDSTPAGKAHNMVSHLKDNNNSDPSLS